MDIKSYIFVAILVLQDVAPALYGHVCCVYRPIFAANLLTATQWQLHALNLLPDADESFHK